MAHYEKDHLTARWNGDLEAVEMEWHDFTEGQPFREGLNAGLDPVAERNATKWLADLREMGTIAEQDQEWSNEEWFPKALQTDLEYMALIQPESVIANMSVENSMQEVGDGALATHYFDNRPEAESRLRDQS